MPHPYLKPYTRIADMLVKTFGTDIEVVLHDLTTPQHSVIYVANNTVTGRHVGDSFQNLITKLLHAGGDSSGLLTNHYYRFNEKLIRSSSMLIRDDEGNLIGALCINIDTTRVTQQIEMLSAFLPGLGENLVPVLHEEPQDPVCALPEGTDRGVVEMVEALIDRIISESPEANSSREKRLELIRFMDTRGVFLVKGAIDRVAERLSVSKVTVYAYLDEVRGKRA